jgi:hypothetical protein
VIIYVSQISPYLTEGEVLFRADATFCSFSCHSLLVMVSSEEMRTLGGNSVLKSDTTLLKKQMLVALFSSRETPCSI